ncbi:MAG: hypothetical protein WDN28_15725 [Chthoniobacter sp.]
MKNQGRVAEAVAAYRQAIEQNPVDPRACSNLIYTLQFVSDDDAGKAKLRSSFAGIDSSAAGKRIHPAPWQ